MNGVIPALRTIIRDQLDERQEVRLGVVTQVFTNQDDSGDHNIAVNLRLQGSACELYKAPVMVSRLGMSLAPRVDDLAVVIFIGGDLNNPVVIGFLYDEQHRAPAAAAEEVVYLPPDEADDETRRLHIGLAGGGSLTLRDGKLEVLLGSTTVTVEADGAVVIEAGSDIRLNASGALNLEAGGDVGIKGKNIAIEAKTSVDIKGATLTAEAQGSTTVKGATIKLAGMTDFSPA
ncbi:MAG: phage baseplate assembly protein V [Desulfobulbus sp.]|jgi:phage baseplate assembly protein gpV